MKIYDLTRGKYPEIYSSIDFYSNNVEQMANYSSKFQLLFANNKNDIDALLKNIPVFLVDSSMANEYVAVPGCQLSIRVPEDKYGSLVDSEDFDIDNWAGSKEGDLSNNDDPCERTSRGFAITDLLGVYIHTSDFDVIPRRIFIWMDKISDYAENNTKAKVYKDANAHALFDLVLYHEMSHALMDVELYCIHPSPKFTYANDYPYRFYEEAYANGLALTILWDKSLSQHQKSFIEQFVKNQGPGYSDGWMLTGFSIKQLLGTHINEVYQWMGIKVLFNFEIILLLKNMWKDRPFLDLVFESVNHDGWIAVKDRNNKWGIIELPGQKAVAGFRKYDSFWPFDENGLCKVQSDQEHGCLYGYVNEQGDEQIPLDYEVLCHFEKGIAIAKKDGRYGAIDMNNQVVIPFNLTNEADVQKRIQK